MARWWTIGLMVGGVVACSGDDGDDGTDTPTSLPTGPTTPTPTGPTPTVPTQPTGSTDTADTAPTDTGVVGTPVELSAPSAEVHPEVGSLFVVSWDQSAEADVRVDYQVGAEGWQSTPVRARGPGAHQQIVAGVPYETEVSWRVVATDAFGETVTADATIETGDRPDFLPVATVNTYDAAGVDPTSPFTLLSVPALDGGFGGAWFVMVVDRLGRPVWARRSQAGRMSMHPRLSYDGTAILHDQNSFWTTFDSSGGTVEKLRLDGSLVHTWTTPGLHHPHQEMPDGSLAYGAFVGFYDESLAITAPDDSISYLWSCDDWSADIGASTGCASNTLNYDEATDTFLFSFWTHETVVQIDRKGNALRWFGHAPGSYAFDPVESTFWFQHGAHLTEQGTLLISTHQEEENYGLVTREYTIDEAGERLVEVWNAGIDEGVLGYQMGDAYRTPGGHTQQSYGTQARVREYASDGTVVWDLAYTQVSHIGRVTPIADLYALVPELP
jgi:hypothetical protein